MGSALSRRPSHRNRHYVESRLAYRIQEKAYGALPTNIRKMLVEAGAKHSKIKTTPGRSARTLLMPGTTLIREWDERQHRVTVTPDGLYELNGQVFKSLSAAARHITGTQWNGPRFLACAMARGWSMSAPLLVPPKRCAVYCRVSSDERLDQSFNSIDAQKEAGHAFIKSQSHEGWIAVADDYDDGGFSGGNMDRPALKRLMTDIQMGKVDIVVVYKIDRLSRSLADFARMVDVFDRHRVSFSAVTQQINSATSMGRLMLNVLLSFAQFEREVTGERIRDKIAASKAKGMWMGGPLPLGYDVRDRLLIVNDTEAKLVRRIFDDFVTVRSATLMARPTARKEWSPKAASPSPSRPSTRCCTTGCIWARSSTRGRASPASIRPSSRRASGTRCTR